MFPSSLAVVLTGFALGMGALGAFVWAWRRGLFADLDRQARVLFDERDLRLERPWETARQRSARRAAAGELLAPSHGEWGGAE